MSDAQNKEAFPSGPAKVTDAPSNRAPEQALTARPEDVQPDVDVPTEKTSRESEVVGEPAAHPDLSSAWEADNTSRESDDDSEALDEARRFSKKL